MNRLAGGIGHAVWAARQRGAALITCLVMLLVLTILGTASIRTARLELLLADNQRTQQEVFDAAEGGIDLAMDAMLRDGRVPAAVTATLSGGAEVFVSTTLKAITAPSTYDASYPHPADVRALHLELRAAATAARGARTAHVQGLYLLAHGLDDVDDCLDAACLPAFAHCANLACITFDTAHYPARTYWTREAPE